MKIPKPWRVAAPIAEPPLAAGWVVAMMCRHVVVIMYARAGNTAAHDRGCVGGCWILQAKVLSILVVYQINEYKIHIVGKLGDSDIFIG